MKKIVKEGENYLRKPIHIRHRSLKRASKYNDFVSFCPICYDGILPMQDEKTFKLKKHDRCNICGQRFIYTDINNISERLKAVSGDKKKISLARIMLFGKKVEGVKEYRRVIEDMKTSVIDKSLPFEEVFDPSIVNKQNAAKGKHTIKQQRTNGNFQFWKDSTFKFFTNKKKDTE